jgi:hypothetical protein
MDYLTKTKISYEWQMMDIRLFVLLSALARRQILQALGTPHWLGHLLIVIKGQANETMSSLVLF